MSKELEVAIKAAKEAGEILKNNFQRESSVTLKEDGSFQTEADRLSEEKINLIIKESFPTHSILAEESGLSQKKSTYLWLIDPLDGTTNYTIKFPFFAASIALAKEGVVQLGVIYNPILNDLFVAERSAGATLNDSPIKVTDKENLAKTFIGYSRSQKKKKEFAQIFPKVELATRTPKILGSVALQLCYVANGVLDASVSLIANSWDTAAGALIVEEAGGKITDLKGNKWSLDSENIFASNGKIHDELLAILNKN